MVFVFRACRDQAGRGAPHRDARCRVCASDARRGRRPPGCSNARTNFIFELLFE